MLQVAGSSDCEAHAGRAPATQLSAARRALAANAAALDAARRQLVAAGEPIRRANEIIAAEAAAAAAVKTIEDNDASAVAGWLQHGRGPRPRPNAAKLAEAQRRAAEATQAAKAAKAALPRIEAEGAAVRARVAALEAEFAQHVRAVQLEHAAELAGRVTALLTEAAAERARYYALAQVFAEAGRAGDHGAFRDAETLGRMAPPVQLDPSNADVDDAARAWRAFAAALAGDPNAALSE